METTAQFVMDSVCEQEAAAIDLKRLANRPVVLWVRFPGIMRPCGHVGYLVESLQKSSFKVKNGNVPTYVCEKMGRLIE